MSGNSVLLYIEASCGTGSGRLSVIRISIMQLDWLLEGRNLKSLSHVTCVQVVTF